MESPLSSPSQESGESEKAAQMGSSNSIPSSPESALTLKAKLELGHLQTDDQSVCVQDDGSPQQSTGTLASKPPSDQAVARTSQDARSIASPVTGPLAIEAQSLRPQPENVPLGSVSIDQGQADKAKALTESGKIKEFSDIALCVVSVDDKITQLLEIALAEAITASLHWVDVGVGRITPGDFTRLEADLLKVTKKAFKEERKQTLVGWVNTLGQVLQGDALEGTDSAKFMLDSFSTAFKADMLNLSTFPWGGYPKLKEQLESALKSSEDMLSELVWDELDQEEFIYLLHTEVSPEIKKVMRRAFVLHIIQRADLSVSNLNRLLEKKRVLVLGSSDERKSWKELSMWQLVENLRELRNEVVHTEFKFTTPERRERFLSDYREFIDKINWKAYYPLSTQDDMLKKYREPQITAESFHLIEREYYRLIKECYKKDEDYSLLQGELKEVTVKWEELKDANRCLNKELDEKHNELVKMEHELGTKEDELEVTADQLVKHSSRADLSEKKYLRTLQKLDRVTAKLDETEARLRQTSNFYDEVNDELTRMTSEKENLERSLIRERSKVKDLRAVIKELKTRPQDE